MEKTKMRLEAFGEALNMAVDEQFKVDEGLIMIVDAMSGDLSRCCMESVLTLIRANQKPGLRLEAAQMLGGQGSGDKNQATLRAVREQAVAGVVRSFVRKNYQEIVQSETKRNY